MRSSTEHQCPHCRATFALRGAQIFIPLPCPACGVVSRAREEIGGYRLGAMLKRSGLGVIFAVADRAGESLAVKLLQPALAAEAANAEDFVSEVQALAELDHPHCVRIHASGVDGGVAWLVMEWLAGGSLADRLAERGRLPEAEVLAIGLQAAAVLGAAQAAGHTHRDVEPNNLVFADATTIKVTDFGQATLYQAASDDLGTIWGRAWQVSPERLRNEAEEAPGDIYSLGATLFYALTGAPLRAGEPNGQLVLELVESREVRVEDEAPSLHEGTALVLNRMLASEPTERFAHWEEVVAQLEEAAAQVARREASVRAPIAASARRTARIRSRLRTLVVVVLLALTAAAGLFAWRHRPDSPLPASHSE